MYGLKDISFGDAIWDSGQNPAGTSKNIDEVLIEGPNRLEDVRLSSGARHSETATNARPA